MRKINLKFLAGSILALGLLAVGVHFLHAFQVKHNAGAFLRLADQAEADGKRQEAANYLRLYLGYMPQDIDAEARLGLLLDQLARSPKARMQALWVLERTLVRDPARENVRRRVVSILMDPYFQRYGDARDHLELLLRAHPEDGELEQQIGQCHLGLGEFRASRSWFENAIRHGPSRVEAYPLLAGLLRDQGTQVKRDKEDIADVTKQADQVMDEMIAANPESYQAYLARARYRKQLGKPKDFAADVARAQELAPDQADVLLAMAEVARDEGELDKARGFLRRGCEQHPQNMLTYQALARLEVQAIQREEAVTWLRKGVEACPENPLLLLMDLGDALIQLGRLTEAEDVLVRLRKEGLLPELLDLFQARILVQKDQWHEATRILERIQMELVRLPDQSDQANLLLGRCYEQMADPDRAYIAYRRAAFRDPLSVPACLGMGSALTSMGTGKLDEAINTYGRITTRLPAAHLQVARLLLVKNLRLPADLRRWKEVDRALDDADRLVPRPPEVVVLRAEALAARDQTERGLDLLVAARDKEPKQVELWIALASFTGRLEKPEAALLVLDEAQQQLGDRVELRLARAPYWAARRNDEAVAALANLGDGLDKFSSEEQRRLLQGLASAYLQAGKPEEAGRLWQELARRQPNDLGIKLNLFDLALRAGNEEVLKTLPTEMQRIEGDEGTFWRYSKARYWMWLAQKGDKSSLERARLYLTDVVARRPTWARAVLVQAEVEDLLGNAEAAIPAYQQAVNLGERNPLAIGRLAQLLFARQRYAEAEQVAQKLSEQAVSGDLQRMLSAISLQTQEGYPRALELAQKAAANSKDFRDYLWLGQVLAAKPERQAEAEAALRRAVELADQNPDPQVTLVQFLVRTSQKEKAEAAVKEAEQKLTRDKFPLALARCYEVIGNRDQAKELYQAAAKTNPQDPLALRAIAGFYVRTGQLKEAADNLHLLIDLGDKAPQDVSWARRSLAIVLTVQGNYQQTRQALAILGGEDAIADGPSSSESIEDQRARAIVLATQNSRAQRLKAIRILENLVANQAATAADKFLLAQLHEAVANWTRSREQMLKLLTSRDGENPAYISNYIRSLLRHNELDEAQLWLTRLEKLEQPTANMSLQTLTLKTQLLKAQGKVAEAVSLVNAYAKGRDAQAGTLAALLEQIGQTTAAEEMYRKYVGQAKRPENAFALVQFLGRQNRLAEAIDLCEKAWPTSPPETAASASVALIYSAKAEDKDYQRVARLLEGALEKKPDSTVLLEQLAAVRNLQGRYDEAEDLYRKAVDRDGQNSIAMNNLAWLLAFRKDKAGEALELIRKALEVTGPDAGTLDTRAMVYLSLGQPAQAVKDLEDVVTESPSATYYFHLAQAHWKAKNLKEAGEAWAKAKTAGIKDSNLHPLERAAYQQLAAEFDSK